MDQALQVSESDSPLPGCEAAPPILGPVWNPWYENEKLERVHWKAIKIVRRLEPKLCKERLREMSYLAWRRQEGNQLHNGWEERRQSQTLLRRTSSAEQEAMVTGKALILCKHCSARAKTLLCNQHCFSHTVPYRRLKS